MNFLLPQKQEFQNYYQQIKFELVKNFAFVFSILLTIVLISNYIAKVYSIIPNILSVLICLSGLIILIVTKKYKPVTLGANIALLILISSTYFTITKTLHLVTPLWMILNILTGYFVIGKKWGNFLLFSHFSVLLIYIYFGLEQNILSIPTYNNGHIYNFILEICFFSFGFWYITITYLKTSKHALNQEKKLNKEIADKLDLISIQDREKEIMLQEIHHRVKNNLQIITSILRLQSYEPNSDSREFYNSAITRIESIALIHEVIYKQDFTTNFDLETYFFNLSNNIIKNYNFKKNIKLNVSSKLDCVQCSAIVPIAILLNELITNSIKHAFNDTPKPEIVISIRNIERNKYEFIFSDNGRWKENKEERFGTELIKTVTEQLEGAFKIFKSEEGTKYTFTLYNIED